MNEPAEVVSPLDCRASHSFPRCRRVRHSKIDAPVRPGPVVVLNVVAKDPARVAPAEDEDVVEALSTNSADPTLRERVGPGCPNGRVGYRNAITSLTSDSVAFGAMFYALLYAVIRRILSLGGLSSDTEAEVLVLRHELAVLRRQIKRPRWRIRAVPYRDEPDAGARALGSVHGDAGNAPTLARWHREVVRRKWTFAHSR
jgi:hypothetical protein